MLMSAQRSHCSTVFHQIPARRPRYTRTRKSPACCGSRVHSCWLPSGTHRCLRQKHTEEEANPNGRFTWYFVVKWRNHWLLPLTWVGGCIYLDSFFCLRPEWSRVCSHSEAWCRPAGSRACSLRSEPRRDSALQQKRNMIMSTEALAALMLKLNPEAGDQLPPDTSASLYCPPTAELCMHLTCVSLSGIVDENLQFCKN